MKLTIKSMAIIVVVAFIVGIGGASLLGYWKTTGSKQPVAIKEGEFAGMPNPSDIRGSYTWADVAKAFGIDVNLLMKAFGAAAETEKVNTLEAIYGEAGLPEGVEIGTDSVRLFVSLLTGLPHTSEESTIMPASAIAVLRESGKAESARIDDAAARAWGRPASPEAVPAAAAEASEEPAPAPVPAAPVSAAPASPTGALSATPPAPALAKVDAPAAEHIAASGTITGKTTFKELKDWGLSEEKIKSAVGGEIGPDAAAIRDWAAAKGVIFSELKTALQDLLDAP